MLKLHPNLVKHPLWVKTLMNLYGIRETLLNFQENIFELHESLKNLQFLIGYLLRSAHTMLRRLPDLVNSLSASFRSDDNRDRPQAA